MNVCQNDFSNELDKFLSSFDPNYQSFTPKRSFDFLAENLNSVSIGDIKQNFTQLINSSSVSEFQRELNKVVSFDKDLISEISSDFFQSNKREEFYLKVRNEQKSVVIMLFENSLLSQYNVNVKIFENITLPRIDDDKVTLVDQLDVSTNKCKLLLNYYFFKKILHSFENSLLESN